MSRVRDELHKEHSRRKIDRVRFHNGVCINAGDANGSNTESSDIKGMGFNNDEQIDNAIKNGGDVMTLSLFYRPCKNTTAEYYTNDGNP